MRLLLLPLVLLLLTGCASIGPGRIQTDRKSYNDMVRQTDYQQLLTNIVHLAYVEPTLYLRVTNITASYSLNENLNANASLSRYDGYDNNTVGISPGVSYSDSPTISYVPVDDTKFVTMMYKPISFDNITLLMNGGINDFAVLARLAFNRVGHLDNAISATSPKMVEVPHYKRYYRFVHLVIHLLQQQLVTLRSAEFKDHMCLLLEFKQKGMYSKNARELRRLLEVTPNARNIIFMARNVIMMKGVGDTTKPYNRFAAFHNIVYVQTRSADSMLAFLSHAVEFPQSDVQSHFVPKELNTAPLMNGLMRIQTSNTEPHNTFVKTFVNHHWFYISDSDMNSKVTFTLLVRLMTLVSGYQTHDDQQAPVITVPVGANRN